MSVFFEWDDSIALGIPTIDDQHKAIFHWINTLHEAVNSGDGHEKVGDIINNLISYVTEHFSEEERLMLSCDYPQLVSHRKEHDRFVTRLQEIQTRYNDGDEMGQDILDFMVEWLVCHIKGTDQGYNRYISERKVK